MATVHHRYITVRGRQLFYREAGAADAPAVVLLHGFPASSFMFRDLIPLLADRYHVIAPDHLGFGLSDAPPADEFTYTFDALADLTADLLAHLGITRYAMYVQDYGAPVGWRLALAHPDAITAVITQNGNGYEAGLAPRMNTGGSFVIFSGVAAAKIAVGTLGVAITNAAADTLARSLALELSPIRVNAISPGVIDTGAWDAFGEQGKADYFADISARNPARRIGTPTTSHRPSSSP